jgi:AcrR family transcriptional regulator
MPAEATIIDPAFVDAARRAFERHGYAGASLERIADEAGVSRVTLHRRGISKSGLLAELVRGLTDDYRRRLWPALTADGDGATRLEEALVALCASAEENLGLLLALQAQTDQIFHDHSSEEVLTQSVFSEPLERLLRDGIADGSIREFDPAEMATVLFNLVGWTYIHLRSGHGWSAKKAREAVLEPALHGILDPARRTQ